MGWGPASRRPCTNWNATLGLTFANEGPRLVQHHCNLALTNASAINIVPFCQLLFIAPPHGNRIPNMKRHRSPDAAGEGSSRAKLAKPSSETTATEAETEQLSESHPKLCITVHLGSATKAARNDPESSSSPDAVHLGLAGAQNSAQHRSPADPAATANSRQPSRQGDLDSSNE